MIGVWGRNSTKISKRSHRVIGSTGLGWILCLELGIAEDSATVGGGNGTPTGGGTIGSMARGAEMDCRAVGDGLLAKFSPTQSDGEAVDVHLFIPDPFLLFATIR